MLRAHLQSILMVHTERAKGERVLPLMMMASDSIKSEYTHPVCASIGNGAWHGDDDEATSRVASLFFLQEQRVHQCNRWEEMWKGNKKESKAEVHCPLTDEVCVATLGNVHKSVFFSWSSLFFTLSAQCVNKSKVKTQLSQESTCRTGGFKVLWSSEHLFPLIAPLIGPINESRGSKQEVRWLLWSRTKRKDQIGILFRQRWTAFQLSA